MKEYTAFDAQDLPLFETEAKVGLVATLSPGDSPDRLPHITLITSLQAKDPQTLIFGQFSEGQSKKNLAQDRRAGFLIMTMERCLWRGKADWTHSLKEGDDYAMFNQKPMFRYNAYFGIHTVHYLDLVSTTGRRPLPLAKILPASLLTALAGNKQAENKTEHILSPWAYGLFNGLTTLKFLSVIGPDGYPSIIPLLQCRAANDRQLTFSPFAYKDELTAITPGSDVAVLAMSMNATSVLIRGKFQGLTRKRLITVGNIDIDWVYNSMPPVPGQIYPPVELKPVTTF